MTSVLASLMGFYFSYCPVSKSEFPNLDLTLGYLGRGLNFDSEGLRYTKWFSFSDNDIRFVCAIKCVQKCPRRFYRTQCANESSKLFLWVSKLNSKWRNI